MKFADSLGHVRADGVGILSFTVPPGGKKVICALPPAQAAVNLKITTEGKLGVKAKGVAVDAAASSALEQAAARLFEQNEQTLFVQHTLYRLCEANANGMLEGVSAKDILLGEHTAATARLERVDYELGLARADLARLTQQLTAARTAHQTTEAARASAEKKAGPKPLGDERVVSATQERDKAKAELLAAEAAEAASSGRVQRLTAEEAELVALQGALATAMQHPVAAQTGSSAYGLLFIKIFSTAARLSEIDVDRARALADRAKAEADKAKADVEKAKYDIEKVKAEKTKVEEKLEALTNTLVDASVTRAKRVDCKAEEKKADSPTAPK